MNKHRSLIFTLALLLGSIGAMGQPGTQLGGSYPQALSEKGACILLTSGGYYLPAGTKWNNGQAYQAPASNLNPSLLTSVWKSVAEDFAPFNVTVTTNDSIFNTFDKTRRIRCIISPESAETIGYEPM
ncbi:MAG: hypothetical protein EOP52_10200 [Sphingobacteriales bacterium]|nr:MAG: hypothetical protein EOP52_10200 [Sphingobacteriales bacterium]